MFIRVIITLFILLAFELQAQVNKVAITFDDLPCTNCIDTEASVRVNQKILASIKAFQAPAIGFVNEGKLYTANQQVDERKKEILQQWLEQGLELGNHTYSHIVINNVSVEAYEADLLKGEKITRPMMKSYGKELKWFRHTQLRTGPTSAYKKKLDEVLQKHGYSTAPVTIDNDEYVYAYCYHHALKQGDSISMRLIAYDYLSYIQSIIGYYESLSRQVTGRNINHVLLLHANELNADYLGELLTLFKQRNYEFIGLDEALTDKVYQLPEAQSPRGLSWLHRWQLAKGDEITSHPDVSARIQERMQHYSRNDTPFKSQHFTGDERDIQAMLKAMRDFSSAYVHADYDALVNAFATDAKIFPNNADIIEGHKAIKQRWTLPPNQRIMHHLITPLEITIMGDTAYDHGYYEGTTAYANGTTANWRGKYVVVWKKVDGTWKMYLDCWNRNP